MDKLRCVVCGAEIMPATAAKNGGRCMPCAKGTRRVPEDFGLVRQKWARVIVPGAPNALTRFAARYAVGEERAVWDELYRLDPRCPTPQAVWDDAVECVRLAMRRVRSNVETLVKSLHGLGHQFWYPADAHRLPCESDRGALDDLEALCGPLPLTLRLFYEEVGSVDFRQSPDQLVKWMDEGRAQASPLQLLGEEDPLVVFPVTRLVEEAKKTLPRLSRLFTEPPGTSRLYCCLAPDECFKAGYGGGENYNLYLPEPAVDFPLVGAWTENADACLANEDQYPVHQHFGPSEFFISHLRHCFQGGGFRGRSDLETAGRRVAPQWEELRRIAGGLLAI
jgi:hypothetical protein